jgi:pilus assembly protein CpaC
MNRRRIKGHSLLWMSAAAILLATSPSGFAPAIAASIGASIDQVSDAPIARRLQMGVGKSAIIDLPEDAGEIFVGDPKVANAVVRSSRRLYIAAIGNGQTTVFAMNREGHQIAVIEISIGRDVGELQELLRVAIPGNDITVKTVADSVILMGSVASAAEAQKALDIASGFIGTSVLGGAPSGGSGGGGSGSNSTNVSISSGGTPVTGKVINSLTIRGLDQVSLRVTVAEIRREIVKQLGVTMASSQASGAFNGSNFATSAPFAVNGNISAASALLDWTKGGSNFQAQLQAFERQGVARTLAEPTVTAVSGESAKFLAGGTIPLPNGITCQQNTIGFGNECLVSILQQPYGVSLGFTPVVLSPGRIQLRIATEVTDIDQSKQITLGEGGTNVSIPGFRTRKNETTVELPSGGSIASAGLISTETTQVVNGVPGLMNLPILGALFRSRDFLRDETELLIVVTPYIVHAIDPGQVVKPDQNYTDASDPQTWLLGRVNRLYSSSGSAQGLQNYNGKIGFINE